MEARQILSELKAIRRDIDFIKFRIEDVFLTTGEQRHLEEAEKEHRKGKSVSLKEFHKHMCN